MICQEKISSEFHERMKGHEYETIFKILPRHGSFQSTIILIGVSQTSTTFSKILCFPKLIFTNNRFPMDPSCFPGPLLGRTLKDVLLLHSSNHVHRRFGRGLELAVANSGCTETQNKTTGFEITSFPFQITQYWFTNKVQIIENLPSSSMLLSKWGRDSLIHCDTTC